MTRLRKMMFVRIQSDFGAAFYGFREYVCIQLARQYGWNGFIEKESNVPAVARPGPRQGSGDVHLLACFEACARILLPPCFVLIGGQAETGLIPKHRIVAPHEHSEREYRFILLGVNSAARTLILVHCYKENES